MSDGASSIDDSAQPEATEGGKRLWTTWQIAERNEIARALIENGHNRTHSAMALGISRRTLLNKIKQHGLTRMVCRQLAGDVLPQAPARMEKESYLSDEPSVIFAV